MGFYKGFELAVRNLVDRFAGRVLAIGVKYEGQE
jgi:hypothetical protein